MIEKNVFIIGSKGIPARYGGFETFVEKLTEKKMSCKIKYHVACLSYNNDEFEYNNARCFNVSTPKIGAGQAVYYDIKALKYCLKYIEENQLTDCIIYILACRIGPFLKLYSKRLSRHNCKIFVNPDGHEWKRAKWNRLIKQYWKISEKFMIKYTDLVICDSLNIESYMKKKYKKYAIKTKFIAYGADIKKSKMNDTSEIVKEWFAKYKIKEKNYYLIVGRFVPENNYEIIIKEFMNSNSKQDLVIITNIQKNKFFEKLRRETRFEKDKRIKFVGTVYNQELLLYIRQNAYGYFHGHEVGGTNPSLLEALATTRLNILLNVGFNREVAGSGAIYWDKSENSLSKLINNSECLSESQIDQLAIKAKERIENGYKWEYIVSQYEDLFLENGD